MSANTSLIESFCAAWSRLDPVELAAFFTEDGIYHNMPTGPVKGRSQIESFIRGFAQSCCMPAGDHFCSSQRFATACGDPDQNQDIVRQWLLAHDAREPRPIGQFHREVERLRAGHG